MSEDVSAIMRVGITVILVAALVATVLNLMVMSNSLLSGGQTTLQSGIDSVSTQEFASFDNTKVSGTQVTTALSLFQGRDIAIIIQTKALAALGTLVDDVKYPELAINYGALLTSDGNASNRDVNMPYKVELDEVSMSDPSAPTVQGMGSGAQSGTLAGAAKGQGNAVPGSTNYITSQAKTVYLVHYCEGTNPGGRSLWRETGAPNYSGYLHNSNGLVDASYDTIGTTELGNAAYILSSSRFSSVLIKDPTGSIIGIFFKQLQ